MENIMASNKTGGSKNNATGDNDIDAIAPIANGVIGVGTTPVGSIIKGYNFVSEEASKSWLTRNAVRIASPEEIKANLG
jgi:hypothetical protein